MSYPTLQAALSDLEKNGMLRRIKEKVDPHLEMAAIQLRTYEMGGPALLFENIKGCRFRAASNIFGTIERSRFLFRNSMEHVQKLIALRKNPALALKNPLQYGAATLAGRFALTLKNPLQKPILFQEIKISDLPQIQHWPSDGGAFITLPQVFSEDPEAKGIMHGNLGMYRVQLSGNEYAPDKEIGLHYQIHRGIGVHQSKAMQQGKDLKVSIFIGGPPAHTLAAVMPLPEGMSELTFAGLLGERRFRYFFKDGFCISTDADFVITGTISGDTKPEGPFGDHLGYYSLAHPFPVMKVEKVFAKKDAIWPFTVVGRPPQEDTSFGALIHELTGEAISQEIPGLKEVNAVDAAGVHPLLLAVGSERYTPYNQPKEPSELLTIANRILGTGQLSLAKYLWIAADDSGKLNTHDIPVFFEFVLRRFRPERDLHFQTKTTIDTLDYSGSGLNKGSKLIVAAYGDVVRELCSEVPPVLKDLNSFENAQMAMRGVVALKGNVFSDYAHAAKEMEVLNEQLNTKTALLKEVPFIILCDEPEFVSSHLNNFLWVVFTRSNPSHDVYGIKPSMQHKHWGCSGPVVIDARIKPHHAPPLIRDAKTEEKVDRLFLKSGSLYGLKGV